MYLYFNNARKLQTMIAHGSPIRQGDSFNLYVCFDLDFFQMDENGEYTLTPLYCYYKKPKASSFESNAIDSIDYSVRLFRKNSYDEVTYKLVDGKKYIMYYYQIPASSEITQQCGELDLVFSFLNLTQQEALNAANLTAQLYVEPTYGKNRPKGDESLNNQTNYQNLLGIISKLDKEKNIALIEMNYIVEDENSTDNYVSLEDRAKYVFVEKGLLSPGWLLVGEKTKTEDEQTTIENTDLFIVLDSKYNYVEENEEKRLVSINGDVLAIEGETGIIWDYKITLDSEGHITDCIETQLTYSKEELETFFGINNDLKIFLQTAEPSYDKPNYNNSLKNALEDFLHRISYNEKNAIYDVKYENDTIKKKIGQNGEYQKVANKTDLGITDIETNAVYDVRCENGEIQKKIGKNGEYQKAANKTDLGIENIENNAIYSVEYSDGNFKVQKGLNGAKQVIAETSQIVQNNSQLLATAKAIFDALEEGAKVSEQANPNLVKFNEAMQKIQYMYDYFNENTEDVDNKINKLEEIIAVLDNLPENYSIFDTIENIYNKLGEDKNYSFFYDESWTNEDKAKFSVKGRIQELEHSADSHIMVFMRYADNQQLFTIPTTAWTTLAEPYTNYPDATCYATIQNNEFKDILDMEIIFDKAVEKELLAGIEVDTTTGVITFYALETPEIAITIDTIKIISNLYHTNSLSLDTIAQVEANKSGLTLANQAIATLTRNVNNINNVELPKYVKKQIDDSNCRTSIENVNETNDRRISLVYKEGNDEHWGINNSVNVFASGIFLSTYKVENENEIIHYLRLTNNGELTLDGVELQTKGNLISLFQVTPDDTHYPSEKLVKDSLDAIKDTTVGGVNLTSSTANLQNYKYDIVQQTVDALVTGNYTLPQTYNLTQFVIPEEGQSYLVSQSDCGIGVTIEHTSFNIIINVPASGTNPGYYKYTFNDNKWYYNDSAYTGSINTFFNATTSNGVQHGQEETMKLILGVQDTTVNVDRTLVEKLNTLAEKNEVPTLRTTTGAINTVDNVIQTETRYMSDGSSAKIGDYLLDKVSNIIKGLYKIISFESSSYSDSRLAILSLVGIFEEAKYQHLIEIDAKTVSGYTSKLHIKIVNSDPLDWNTNKLKVWLDNNNYTNGTVCPYFDGWIRKDSSWEEIAISGIGLDSNSKIVAEIYLDSATLSTIVLEDTLFSVSDKKTKI